MPHTTVQNYQSFRTEIVGPDYQEFLTDKGNLRRAFHCAISLFHLHDWVYAAQKSLIDASYTYVSSGKTKPVTKSSEFANALADVCSDFELIRGIANSAKHLILYSPNPNRPQPPGAPSHAANTQTQVSGWGQGAWGQGAWGGPPVVILEGMAGRTVADIATNVVAMWDNEFKTRGW